MIRHLKLKIIILVSASLFFMGLWCSPSAIALYETASDSVLVGPRSLGPEYFCDKFSLSEYKSLLKATRVSDPSGGVKSKATSEFSVSSPISGVIVQPGLLSGHDRQSIPKDSLHILNSVLIL